AVALRDEPLRIDACIDQVRYDDRGAHLGELLVRSAVADAARVALDLDELDARVAEQGPGNGIERRRRAVAQRRGARYELDHIEDRGLGVGDHDAPMLLLAVGRASEP